MVSGPATCPPSALEVGFQSEAPVVVSDEQGEDALEVSTAAVPVPQEAAEEEDLLVINGSDNTCQGLQQKDGAVNYQALLEEARDGLEDMKRRAEELAQQNEWQGKQLSAMSKCAAELAAVQRAYAKTAGRLSVLKEAVLQGRLEHAQALAMDMAASDVSEGPLYDDNHIDPAQQQQDLQAENQRLREQLLEAQGELELERRLRRQAEEAEAELRRRADETQHRLEQERERAQELTERLQRGDGAGLDNHRAAAAGSAADLRAPLRGEEDLSVHVAAAVKAELTAQIDRLREQLLHSRQETDARLAALEAGAADAPAKAQQQLAHELQQARQQAERLQLAQEQQAEQLQQAQQQAAADADAKQQLQAEVLLLRRRLCDEEAKATRLEGQLGSSLREVTVLRDLLKAERERAARLSRMLDLAADNQQRLKLEVQRREAAIAEAEEFIDTLLVRMREAGQLRGRGSGGFGSVAELRGLGVAMKRVDLFHDDYLVSRHLHRLAEAEVHAQELLGDLPCCLTAHQAWMGTDNLYLVMPLLQPQDLMERWIAPIQEALSSGVAGRVRSARTVVDRTLLALLHAVFRMVERGLLHNDLKPANLALIIADGRVEVKVFDFGLATIDFQGEAPSQCGTRAFMDPMVLTKRAWSARAASDLWAVALTMLQFLPGRCRTLLNLYGCMVQLFTAGEATEEDLLEAANKLRDKVGDELVELGMSDFFRRAMHGLLAVEEVGRREAVMNHYAPQD